MPDPRSTSTTAGAGHGVVPCENVTVPPPTATGVHATRSPARPMSSSAIAVPSMSATVSRQAASCRWAPAAPAAPCTDASAETRILNDSDARRAAAADSPAASHPLAMHSRSCPTPCPPAPAAPAKAHARGRDAALYDRLERDPVELRAGQRGGHRIAHPVRHARGRRAHVDQARTLPCRPDMPATCASTTRTMRVHRSAPV